MIIKKDDAWIGMHVTIGEGAIVGAGSVVTKEIPDWTIFAVNPAKLVKELPEKLRDF